jgi:protein FRA10AC1
MSAFSSELASVPVEWKTYYGRHMQFLLQYMRVTKPATDPARRLMEANASNQLPSDYDALALSELRALHDSHEFIMDEKSDRRDPADKAAEMARQYWQKLYKEYALADLSRTAEGRIGLRWRTESEVVAGKGQFSCASVSCTETHPLTTLELPFRYVEKGEVKSALVKTRLCGPCALLVQKADDTRLKHEKEVDKASSARRHSSRRDRGAESVSGHRRRRRPSSSSSSSDRRDRRREGRTERGKR